MVQIMIGAGVDADGNLVACYLGPDASAAKDAVDSAGVGGKILEGYVFKNPQPQLTLRYGPELVAAVSAGS